MFAALTAALCVAQAAPVAITRDEAYAAAVQERITGRSAEAIAHFRAILADHPDDVDSRLQLGLALKAAGQDGAAADELRAVLRQAPDYKDARVALADLKLARGDVAGARETLGPELLAAQGDSDVAGLLQRMDDAAATARWRLDASALLSNLSDGSPEWKEANLSVSRKIAARSALTARVQQIERFAIDETYLEAEFDHGWTGGEWAVTIGGSLDPTFRAERAIKASVLLIPKKNSPWRLGADVNYSHYVGADVTTVRAGVDRYIDGDRGLVSLRAIETSDPIGKTLWGGSIDGSWRFTDRIEASGSYVNAAETDSGVVVRTSAYGGALAYKLSERTTLQATLLEEMRDNSYDRLEFGLGVTLRF